MNAELGQQVKRKIDVKKEKDREKKGKIKIILFMA